MAKTEVQSSVEQRLREYLRLEDRFNHLDRTRRWSSRAMRSKAFSFYSEERLRELHKAITKSPDPGSLPQLLRRIQNSILRSPNYLGYVPPSRAGHILALWPGAVDRTQHDLSRFGTSLAEVYALSVLLAVEDPSMADAFGPCDDPDRADREMADLKAKMDSLKQDLRTRFSGDDVAYADVQAGGRRLAAAYYRVSGGEVELGAGPDSLVNWARQHRTELGV